jgi:phage/plasmid-associated DNA primase
MKVCARWERFLEESIGNAEQIEQLREFMRVHLTPGGRVEKALLLCGSGVGKSTLVEVIAALTGDNYVVRLQFHELDNVFTWIRLVRDSNKPILAYCLEPDVSRGRAACHFKSIIHGDSISVAYKGKPPFLYSPFVNFIFEFNGLKPEYLSVGVQRRMIPIQFQVHLENPRNSLLLMELIEELEAIRQWVFQSESP